MFDRIAPPEADPASGEYGVAMRRARARDLSVAELISTVETMKATGDARAQATLYKTWLAYNAGHPLYHAILFNYATVLSSGGEREAAILALHDAVRLAPDFSPPYINLGSLYDQIGTPQHAVSTWNALVGRMQAVNGESVRYKCLALNQMGRVLEAALSDAAAESVLRESLDIDPAQTEALQHWLSLRQR